MKELYFGQGRIVLVGILNGFNFKELKIIFKNINT
jgi:hypothetical protein